jgi:DNA-binding beta-propeller fold protein YncE
VLLGRWLALQEPKQLNEMRRIDGADTLAGLWTSTWPRLAAAAIASFVVVLGLSAGEVVLTSRLQPPGFEAVAGSVLNAVHYQRPEIVVAALVVFVLLAVVGAALIGGVWMGWRRVAAGSSAATLAILVVSLGGCVPEETGDATTLLPQNIFGGTGAVAGKFEYPRAMAVDREREIVYVVDKTARIQRFDRDGKHLGGWLMPEYETGKPTGLNVGPDGTVYVADTHYYRVVVFDPDGRERFRFGGYGEEPGKFIYTTDIAFGPKDRLYVSEYGGNDRIQVFTKDGEYEFEFGGWGEERGQFNRPQSMTFDESRTKLFVADACNHRIVVLDPEGKVLSIFGGQGRAPGQLLYPYDLALLDDGSLLVAEYGNNRIQHLAADGQSLGVYGSVGTAEGQLKYPWGVDVTDDHAFVLDSGNNRVQVVNLP